MPPRAMWTGQVRLSLVSFGVRLYAATETARRVSMNQLHQGCHQRLRNQLVCPVHGPVNRDEIAKGYEYEKDTYVIIEQSDLDAIRLQSTKTIDLVQFVDPAEIDPLFFDSPYYLGPDGPVAEQAFRVIHEAMRRTNRVGIGTVVLHAREQVVALTPSGKGFLLTTLRYASEVRSPREYFADMAEGDLDEQQVDLARTIMDGRTGPFEPAAFTDHYQEAFFEAVRKKIEGREPVLVEDEETPRPFNFMEALKQSVATADAGKTAGEPASKKKPAASKKKPAARSAAKKPAAGSVGSKKKRAKRA